MTCYNASCAITTTGGLPDAFASAVQFFAASQCLLSEGSIKNDDVPKLKYDFIIIGAGSAGSVIANRLSKKEDCNVLLIEAGDNPPIEANIPGLAESIRNTKNDWQYLTTNNGEINQANINGSIYWPRGKMVGGSSNLNAMIFIEGNDYDYQCWHDAGNKEWSVKEVRRCFRKLESYQNLHLLKDPNVYTHYGHDGPLVINTFNSTFRIVTEKILSSMQEMGIKKVPDLNTANVLGAGITAVTAANGERQSSNKAYLNPVLHRPNLKILKNALVTKILIKRSRKAAYGVEVKRGSKRYNYLSSKEVIVSAGAINSPQLLMLSGIGPKEQLASKNIKPLIDSPMVGGNLQDHCFIPVIICVNESNPENIRDRNFDVIRYLYNRTGYLAQHSISDLLSFYSSDINATYPDYQSHLIFVWQNTSNLYDVLTKRFRYKATVADPIVELNKNYTIFMFFVTLLHPISRGNVLLRSNDPTTHPLIYPNYFKDPRDLDSVVTGIKMFTEILDTEYFRHIGAFLARMYWSDCDVHELNSREYWKCVCINMVLTVYHPVGTCMMGPNPSTSVVNSRLKVHGIENLRVIDASIMPCITSGNTNGPATMIGERGAEIVKEDYEIN